MVSDTEGAVALARDTDQGLIFFLVHGGFEKLHS